jgi:hypothetical protein
MTYGLPLSDQEIDCVRYPKADPVTIPRIVIPYHDEIVSRNERERFDIESVCHFSDLPPSIIYNYHLDQHNKFEGNHWSIRYSDVEPGNAIQHTTQLNKDKVSSDGCGEKSGNMNHMSLQEVGVGKDKPSRKKGTSKREDSREKDNDANSNKNNNEGNANPSSSNASPWTEQLHRQLVEAVYEIGISHASPAVIMEHMRLLNNGAARASSIGVRNPSSVQGNPTNDVCVNDSMIPYYGQRDSRGSCTNPVITKNEAHDDNSQDADFCSNFADVTSERVKSHLQKYRKNKEKSKEEFMSEYDSWLQNTLGAECVSSENAVVRGPTSTSNDDISGDSGKLLLGGEFAAFLTRTVMNEDMVGIPLRRGVAVHPNQDVDETISDAHGTTISIQNQERTNTDASRKRVLTEITIEGGNSSRHKRMMGARIPFPVLTEDEKNSYLGESISHVASLFYSMTNHLMKIREEKGRQQGVGAERPISVSPLNNQQTLRPCSDGSVVGDSLASGSLNPQQQVQESRIHATVVPTAGQRSDATSVGSRNTIRSVSGDRRASDPQMFQRNTSTLLSNQLSEVHRYRMQQHQPQGPEPRTGHNRQYEMLGTRSEQPWSSSRQNIGSYHVQARYEGQSKQRLVNFNWHRYDESGTWSRLPDGVSPSQVQRHSSRQHTPQPTLQTAPAPSPGQQSETRQPDRHEQSNGPLSSIYESYYSDFQPLPSDQENNI